MAVSACAIDCVFALIIRHKPIIEVERIVKMRSNGRNFTSLFTLLRIPIATQARRAEIRGVLSNAALSHSPGFMIDSSNHNNEASSQPPLESEPEPGNILVRLCRRYLDKTQAALDRSRAMPVFSSGQVKESFKVFFAPVSCCVEEVRVVLRRLTHTKK